VFASATGRENISVAAAHLTRSIPPNLKLRILPLGDSITFGIGGTGWNGYRGDLYKKLTAAGVKVDYVGSLKSGNFGKTSNSGYPGYTISQISAKADNDLERKPNVVCLMAGTNDYLWGSTANQDPKTAPERITALVDKIVKRVPDAAVLVASLPPQSFTGKYAKYQKSSFPVEPFNKQIPLIANAAADRGGKVLAVDMGALTLSDLDDGVHPNDAGYAKMATAWFKAIEEAASKGWIKDPVNARR